MWGKLRESDELLSAKAPWKIDPSTSSGRDDIKKVLEPVAQNILNVAYYLQPFMPATAEKIIKQFSAKQVRKGEILFPRVAAK